MTENEKKAREIVMNFYHSREKLVTKADSPLTAAIAAALDEARERERERLTNRDAAVQWLESIGADSDAERVLLAQFLATSPTVRQIYLATTLAIWRAEREVDLYDRR
jgi:hypothetical protein